MKLSLLLSLNIIAMPLGIGALEHLRCEIGCLGCLGQLQEESANYVKLGHLGSLGRGNWPQYLFLANYNIIGTLGVFG